MTRLRLGTRGSQLALWQARTVAQEIRRRGGPESEIVVVRTSGDRLAEAPLSEAGGKRLFVKELEDALLGGEIDAAVHSAKDMSALLPDGLIIGAVPQRADPLDAVVTRADAVPRVSAGDVSAMVAAVGQAARIGTSSVRRIAQLTQLLPGATFQPIRGNLDTRLRKLDAGEYDILILAAAGLQRLGYGERIWAVLPVSACVPAPGQGTLAIEIRADESVFSGAIARVDDEMARATLTCERAVVTALGGGCQLPLGALARLINGGLTLDAIVTSPDGRNAIRATAVGTMRDPAALGNRVADQLLAEGAATILLAARPDPRSPDP